MKLEKTKTEALLNYFSQAGRGREDSEAWTHALFDIQESYRRIFEVLLPEALEAKDSARAKREVLWEIREELRHIGYHVDDIEGR